MFFCSPLKTLSCSPTSHWQQFTHSLFLDPFTHVNRVSLVAQRVKHLPVMQETCLIPGSGRSPGEGNGNPLQYSCLENPMERGAWWAIVHRVSKSWTRLCDYTTLHTQTVVKKHRAFVYVLYLLIISG